MTRDFLLPSTALPGWGSRKGAEFELSTGVGPDFTPELFLEKDVQMSSHQWRGMMLAPGWS